jgi:molecular chaperone DnaK
MSYDLGVDLGTTFTAPAIARDGRAETVPLAPANAAVPSVAYLNDQGELLFGQVAARRAGSEPARVAREFKRRVGDPTPILLGGTPLSAEMLMARMLAWVVEQVAETEGERPTRLAVTHPANWGAYKLDLLQQATRHVDLTIDHLIAEPVAAAHFYLHNRPAVRERLTEGSALVVYDLGGGTFDAAVIRASEHGELVIAGQPDGVDRLGGVDVDHAVLGHVTTNLGLDPESLEQDDPAFATAWSQLRQDCVAAKEALSDETDTSIPVLLPGFHSEIRLTRSELETMIRPTMDETLVALQRTVASAEIGPADIEAVLLVGGSSRIPLVGQLVAAELDRPIAADARPKDAICHGAVLSLGATGADDPDAAMAAILPPTPPEGTPVPVGTAGAAGAGAGGGVAAASTAETPFPPTETTGAVATAAGARRGFNPLWAAAAIAVVGVLVLGAVLLTRNDDTDPTATTGTVAPPATEAVATGDSTTTSEATTTTENEPTTTTANEPTTTASPTTTAAPPPTESAPPPPPGGQTFTIDGSYERWGGSCYYPDLGTSRPITAEPAAACRDGRGPSYRTGSAAHGSTVEGVCQRQAVDIGDDTGNRSSTWVQLSGGGWMNELYFSNRSAVGSLPQC